MPYRHLRDGIYGAHRGYIVVVKPVPCGYDKSAAASVLRRLAKLFQLRLLVACRARIGIYAGVQLYNVGAYICAGVYLLYAGLYKEARGYALLL